MAKVVHSGDADMDAIEAQGRKLDEREPALSPWKPIVTAPRDGRAPIIVAKFGMNEIGEDCGFWWASKGYFDAKRGCWHNGIERLAWPTHWMEVTAP